MSWWRGAGLAGGLLASGTLFEKFCARNKKLSSAFRSTSFCQPRFGTSFFYHVAVGIPTQVTEAAGGSAARHASWLPEDTMHQLLPLPLRPPAPRAPKEEGREEGGPTIESSAAMALPSPCTEPSRDVEAEPRPRPKRAGAREGAPPPPPPLPAPLARPVEAGPAPGTPPRPRPPPLAPRPPAPGPCAAAELLEPPREPPAAGASGAEGTVGSHSWHVTWQGEQPAPSPPTPAASPPHPMGRLV